ncbi:Arylsulfatase [Pontiella desulfatans]|uniref:Arylsulfatase n=1 Tax=Pontiella desulfatans TaxID=2750659 RepID=A0A6C2TZ95_PONDE|nr:sulfatase-like hydrolase/transferase [Pontiella desulfatans]SPS73714.1 sulfatase S1_39,S1_7 [Kiritimatiellales bacterium]VGO13010.1 Arylsulfatase [Pontiella desulfatans]
MAAGTFAVGADRAPNVIVILMDDMGYADLGIYGQEKDVKTPHLDQLARDGVLCTAGYITAPQCAPSRMGLLTGKYQQRAGFDTIPDLPMRLDEVTIAERLREAGYTTGMVGKWHLCPSWWSIPWAREQGLEAHITTENPRFPGQEFLLMDTGEVEEKMREYYPGHQGFDEYFYGRTQEYWRNFSRTGKTLSTPTQWEREEGFRVDIKTEAALAFIERNKTNPFFLYLAYYAPHTPLASTPEYLSRFSKEMVERRRYGLSMIAAVDDGVGKIRKLLQEYGLEQNTLIFFLSDNGAPLDMTLPDEPLNKPYAVWDGSKNTPWIGEKGMLSEGGIRVPFVVSWPGTFKAGQVCDQPVTALDIAPTALAAAGQSIPAELDGIDLIPSFSANSNGLPQRDLFWRFWGQSAIRRGNWKYVYLSDGRDALYDVSTDAHEAKNLIRTHPEKAQQLRSALKEWTHELMPPGLNPISLSEKEKTWYQFYEILD